MQIKDSISFCIFLTTSTRSKISLKGMELQGGSLGPLVSQLWSAGGRSGNQDHLSSYQVLRSPKEKCIPKTSANAVVVVSVSGLVAVVVEHSPSTKSP